MTFTLDPRDADSRDPDVRDVAARAQQRRALLAERLMVDLARAEDHSAAAGALVVALTTVAGAASAELLLRPAGRDPSGDGSEPAVVLASAARPVDEADDPPDQSFVHRSVDRQRGLELVVRGGEVPDVAVDRGLSALGAMFDRIDAEASLLHEARTDVLTGLLNRRAIDERTASELARASRSGEHVTLLVVDLDGFKQVNDRLGHAAGDAVLRAVADTMQRVARAADDAGRLGGDEFALLLPATDVAGGDAAAHRLNDELGSLPFGVTASIGVATSRPSAVGQPSTVAELARRADGAMYAAKRATDRAVVHADEVS